MTAIECLRCEHYYFDESYCDFFNDVVNNDYHGFCNCDIFWDYFKLRVDCL